MEWKHVWFYIYIYTQRMSWRWCTFKHKGHSAPSRYITRAEFTWQFWQGSWWCWPKSRPGISWRLCAPYPYSPEIKPNQFFTSFTDLNFNPSWMKQWHLKKWNLTLILKFQTMWRLSWSFEDGQRKVKVIRSTSIEDKSHSHYTLRIKEIVKFSMQTLLSKFQIITSNLFMI